MEKIIAVSAVLSVRNKNYWLVYVRLLLNLADGTDNWTGQQRSVNRFGDELTRKLIHTSEAMLAREYVSTKRRPRLIL